MGKSWFTQEYVRCGKATCRTCPHGPYWYEYWHDGPKMKKRYHGRKAPPGVPLDRYASEIVDPFNAIFCKATATATLAWNILGIEPCSYEAARAAHRKLILRVHPDRGGEAHKCKQVNDAWSYLCGLFGW